MHPDLRDTEGSLRASSKNFQKKICRSVHLLLIYSPSIGGHSKLVDFHHIKNCPKTAVLSALLSFRCQPL